MTFDPFTLAGLETTSNRTTPSGAASTFAASPATTTTALGQLVGGAVVLTQGVLEKRRERVAQKDAAAIKAHLEDRAAGIVRTPSPSYKPNRRPVEALLPGPDPRPAQTPEEFVVKMRQMKVHSGLTLRQISERAGMHGELPKSTLGDVLKKMALPKEPLLRHFLQACGLTDEQIAVWEATRKRIAMDQVF